jgi:prevent-host-death family protein
VAHCARKLSFGVSPFYGELTTALSLVIAFVTTIGYHVTMKGVRVAELKSKLSEHLRKVRAGRTVTVLDRTTPIARIVPYEDQGSSMTVRSPLPGAPTLKQISLPPPLRFRRDIVALLLEERQGER